MKRARDDGPTSENSKNKRQRLLARQSLSVEQRELLENITVHKPQKSVFITGGAGSGKSHVLRAIIESLELVESGVFVTASTGLAASEIGGRTLHSFGGIGLGTDPVEVIVKRIRSGDAGKRWRAATTLVIDEVSMLSSEVFDLLDAVACQIRNQHLLPFGGIRLILCGDLLQCPPVTKAPKEQHFIFESKVWSRLNPDVVDLAYSFRQSEDPVFSTMLSEVRMGICSASTEFQLAQCVNKVHPSDALVTTIMALNRDVDEVNAKRLEALTTPKHVFIAKDVDTNPPSGLLKDVRLPATLSLKVGAQVMLLRNLSVELGLFNGAVGTVLRFNEDGLPVVKFATSCLPSALINYTTLEIKDRREVILASRKQIPLVLAWAMTIHKSQGQTICTPVVASLANVFECGMAYVMLSRLRSLQQLSLKSFARSAIKANSKVVQFYTDTVPTNVMLLT